MRVQINEQIKKQIKEKLKNNSFLPFDYKKLKIGHKIILTIVFIVIFFHFSMISFTTSADNLYEYAKIEFRSKLQGILSNNGFSDKNLKMINFNKLKNSIISIYRPKTKSIKISKKKVNKDQQDNFKLNIDTIIAKLNLIEKMFLEFDRLQKELKANDLYSFLFEIISELRKTENSIDKLTEYDKKLKINKLKSPIINIMLKLIKLETRLKELTFNGRNNNLWVNIFYYKQHLNHLNKYFKSAPKIINIDDFENKILKNIISNENKKKLLTYYYKYNKLNSYALISQVTRDEEEKIIDILKSVNHDHFITYKLPRPQYPLISIILKPFAGKQIFPPINLVEIASFLRKSLGSGITIRTKDKKIIEQNLKSINNSQLIALLDGDNGTFKTNNYKNILNNHFYLTIEGSLDNKPLTKTYFTNYNNFYKAINNITNLVKSQAKISWIKLYKNINLSKYIEDQNSDSYGNAKTSSDNFKLLAVRMVSGSKISDIKSKLEELKSKLSIVYTLVLNGKKDDILYQKKFLIRFGDFPSFKKILQRHEYKNISYNKVMLYESKILKYKPNSRELIDFSQIPERVRKAYILVEDDNFYFQAWGVDPIGIIKASLNYVVYHQKKGNASVIEQVYEMYLGKQDKTPFDKFTQLLGAFYLSHYADSRDQFVNLYVQSIPGSFIRDHNYGIKGIIKNYLSKDSLDDLTDKELAWLTRIALRPNEFGQDYVRFLNIKKKLKEYNINIPIGNDIKKFNKQVSKFIKRIKFEVRGILQEKGLSNINNKIVNQFLEIRNLYKLYGKNVLKTKDGINFLENNNLSQESFIELVKEVNEIELIDVNAKTLESLRKSYHATEARINTALNEFRKGNEFMSPLITEKEYQIAKKEEIDFNPSIYLNEYQSYTDQTKKDLYNYVGEWGMNAGLDIEVDFDENAQQILDEELSRSTQTVYNFRDDTKAEHKDYGGAAILVKTHNIKDWKIENKIVAIASKHTEKSNKYFFNWAVDGHRHFGSIFKWIVLLIYLDEKGTLLDSFFDIPRTFEYKFTRLNGDIATEYYRPDNWRLDRDDPYGFFTYTPQNNIYNFLQSKNNTFIRISEIIGIEKISQFFNMLLEAEKIRDKKYIFQPIYPIVLGSQEINSIRFAQFNTVIANKGIFQPITTINRIIESDGSSLILDLSKMKKQVVSREAAEQAFFCGYLNTYFGTAKQFVPGGVGKTGSSDTDVSFLAMTARTEQEWIKENENHLLNNNLLYLVNVGVNEGKIDKGVIGGRVAAPNARLVFEKLLEYHYEGSKKVPKYKIAGDFTRYYSKNFTFVPSNAYNIKSNKTKIPVLKHRKIAYYLPWEIKEISMANKTKKRKDPQYESESEITKNDEPDKSFLILKEKVVNLAIGKTPEISNKETAGIEKILNMIRIEYENRKDIQFEEEQAQELAEKDGLNYTDLSQEKREEYRHKAAVDTYTKRIDSEYNSSEGGLIEDQKIEQLRKLKAREKANKENKTDKRSPDELDSSESYIFNVTDSSKPKKKVDKPQGTIDVKPKRQTEESFMQKLVDDYKRQQGR